MSESRQKFSDLEGHTEGQMKETLKEIQEEQGTSSISLTSREETQQEEIKEIEVVERPHHQDVWSISGPEMSLTTEEKICLASLVSQQATACRDCMPNW